MFPILQLMLVVYAKETHFMLYVAYVVDFSRWRVVRDLVFPQGKAATGLSSQTLLQALQVIAGAQQYATAIDVFSGLQQDAQSAEKKEWLETALLLLKPLGASVRIRRWLIQFRFW